MLRTSYLMPATALFAALALLPQSDAGGQEFKGQVKIGRHEVKLEAGKLYEIVITQPKDHFVYVDTEEFAVYPMLAKDAREDRFFLMPDITEDYHIVVFPGFGFPKGTTFDYALKVKPAPLAKKPIMEVKDKLTEKDPGYSKDWDRHFKDYKVKLKAGKLYVIDLVSVNADLDSYLFLEDAKGKVVKKDDDSGGDLNARILFSPEQDGEFRIIATTLNDPQGKSIGDFSLTVRVMDGEV